MTASNGSERLAGAAVLPVGSSPPRPKHIPRLLRVEPHLSCQLLIDDFFARVDHVVLSVRDVWTMNHECAERLLLLDLVYFEQFQLLICSSAVRLISESCHYESESSLTDLIFGRPTGMNLDLP